MNTFYEKGVKDGNRELSEEEARHGLLVLRLKSGDVIRIVDGLGSAYKAVLKQADKKKCTFEIIEEVTSPEKPFHLHLAIAPTKNIDRIEWMVEKLGEIGLDELTFISSEHSERTRLRIDRLEKKAISAMKQSGNLQLMKINDLTHLKHFMDYAGEKSQKFIAHVDSNHTYLGTETLLKKSSIILIGPEGDFSAKELETSRAHGFIPVSLGKNVLRTETAGLISCQIINMINQY